MALLYRCRNIGSPVVLAETVKKYDKKINENLDAMNSNCGDLSYSLYEETSNFFLTARDEYGNLIYGISPEANTKAAWSNYVGMLPLDVLRASQMDNALEIIGLRLVNGKIIKRESSVSPTVLKLTYKK